MKERRNNKSHSWYCFNLRRLAISLPTASLTQCFPPNFLNHFPASTGSKFGCQDRVASMSQKQEEGVDSSRIHDEIQGVFLLRFRSYIPPPPRAPAGSGNSTFHFLIPMIVGRVKVIIRKFFNRETLYSMLRCSAKSPT